MKMPDKLYEAFDKIFTGADYDINDYHVDLFVMSEYNQVIVVCDHVQHCHHSIPIEDNVLQWSYEKLAETIVVHLDDCARKREERA